MKCVKYTGKLAAGEMKRILRVSDDTAQTLVETGNYEYCPKVLWKRQEREGQ